MDLTNLTTVTKASVQKQNFDLRYIKSSGKFQLSDSFYASKGMNHNGLTFHLAEDGTVPLVSIRPNEDSVFYKGKAGDADKDTKFSYSLLAASLESLGMLNKDENTNYRLEFVDTLDGVSFYQIKEQKEEETEVVAKSEEPEVTDSNEDNTADSIGDTPTEPKGVEESQEEVAVADNSSDEEDFDPFEV